LRCHGLLSPKTLTLEEWLLHKFVPLYLPPYSPELNPIEIICKQAKYHWRSFKTWAKDHLLTEVQELLDGYGKKFHISFKLLLRPRSQNGKPEIDDGCKPRKSSAPRRRRTACKMIADGACCTRAGGQKGLKPTQHPKAKPGTRQKPCG
jgi:hypothetical protein